MHFNSDKRIYIHICNKSTVFPRNVSSSTDGLPIKVNQLVFMII